MTASIESGTSIAHYRVVSQLGKGGMGEVYKAQDLTLDRAVALKILPPDVVKNDERVRRFVQEAKSASSLNHPNIVTIHEIGRAEVRSSDGETPASAPIHYIAMELIDGMTLKQKIHATDTDLRTLLSYLAQAADGLAKAHAAGIVHRDLKPENIMVTRDGFVKVLDFGLAKLSVKRDADGSTSDATAVLDHTREGTLMGTVAYMSPEQVRGKSVDHRTDVFSFGCILYEAATRRRPFEADSDVDVMHRIMHEKPVPIDEINPAVPAEVRRIIRRCLAKDPERRYQSMKDLALELHDAVDEFEELSASTASRSSGSLSQPLISSSSRRMAWLSIAAAAVIAVSAIAFGFYQWRRAHTGDKPLVTYESMKVTPLTRSGNVSDVIISPDGKYVAQVLVHGIAGGSLSVRQVATGADVEIIPTTPIRILCGSFTPDGSYIDYISLESPGAPYSWLFQIPALGGPSRKLLFDIDTPPRFSPDGKMIAFGRGYPQAAKNALMVANADGTSPREIFRTDRLGANPTTPVWTADGKAVMTKVDNVDGGLHSSVVAVDLATHKPTTIGTTRWARIDSIAALPDGKGVVVAGALTLNARVQLWLQPYADGSPLRITNDTNDYAGLSLTADGKTLATMRVDRELDLMVEDGANSGQWKPLLPSAGAQTPLSVDAAATGTIVYSFSSTNGTDIAVIDPGATVPRVVTTDGKNFRPTITGDGRTIVFTSERSGASHIYAMDADGSNVRQLTNGGDEATAVVSKDGRWIVYYGQGDSLYRIPATGGTPVVVVKHANTFGGFSPDSKSIVFTYWRAAGVRQETYLGIMPIAGGALTLDMPWRSERQIRFSAKGDAVTFVRSPGRVANLWSQPLAGGEPRQVTNLSSGIIAGGTYLPDGRMLLIHGDEKRDAILISDFH